MKITFLQPISHLSCFSYEFDRANGTHVAGSCDLDEPNNHAISSTGEFPTSDEQQAIEQAIAKKEFIG